MYSTIVSLSSWTLCLSIFICGLYTYLFINPKDPNRIYKDPKLRLDPTNDEIRLLHLEPGEWEDEIRCKLVKTGLGSNPNFIALSYAWVEKFPNTENCKKDILTNILSRPQFKPLLPYIRLIWGDSRKRLVWVNGHKHEIGTNLELALRHVRNKPGGEEKVLWADAVCINQDDVDDRNNQVSSMRNVYQSAASVEIWLGAERDVCDLDENIISPSGNRFEPTISQDPRGGQDVIWGEIPSRGRLLQGESPGSSSKDGERVESCKADWYKYNNRPKVLRMDLLPDYTMECFCMIHMLGGVAFLECNNKNKRPSPLDHRIPFLQSASARGPVLEVFDEVMKRLWWNRLWVVQETVIAKKVMVRYGRFVIPWDNLVLAAKNFYTHRHKSCCVTAFEQLPNLDVEKLAYFADTVTGLDTWRTTWIEDSKRSDPKIKLLRLLWQFRSRSTSELRDKIYALLPLANYWGKGLQHRPLIPKYEWPVAGVYKNAVRILISVEESLSVLMGNTKKSEKLADELPSWVPDWSEYPTDNEIARLERANLYSASAQEPYHVRILGNNEYLEVRGIEFHAVKELSDVMPREVDAKSYARAQRTFKAWRQLAKLDRTDSNEALIQVNTDNLAFWKTMCMDTVYIGTSKADDDDNLEINKSNYRRAEDKDYEAFSESLSTTGKPESNPDYFSGRKLHQSMTWKPESPSGSPSKSEGQGGIRKLLRRDSPRDNQASTINRAVESATVSRRFFITEKGYMGLGPEHMEIGDIVFVLIGGTVPFLLRKAGMHHIPENTEKPSKDQEHPTNPLKQENYESNTNFSEARNIDTNQTIELIESEQTLGQKIQKPKQCYTLIGDCFVNGIMYGEATHKKGEGEKVNVTPTTVYLI